MDKNNEVKHPTDAECKELIELHNSLVQDLCPDGACNYNQNGKEKQFADAERAFVKAHPQYLFCIPLDDY